jgi:uncharacterized protein YgiM (DUF1202 family)
MRELRRGGTTVLISALALAGALLLAACGRGLSGGSEAIVGADRLKLRSSTAEVARVIAELHSGDRVTVHGRSDEGGVSWAQVTAPDGQKGWVDSRYLVDREASNRSHQLADEMKGVQAQAYGRSKATLKLRLSPDRTAEENVTITLPSGTEFEIVDRERRPRPAANETSGAAQPVANVKEGAAPEGLKFDEWYKVRLKDNQIVPAGWIYGGSVELEVPPEISYFASTGRRIVGWQKIGTARADGESGDNYLVLERRIAGAEDQVNFDRIKVLAYDPARRDYSTPFREELKGKFPVTLKMEGGRGSFQVQTFDAQGNLRPLDFAIEHQPNNRVRVTRLTPPDAVPHKRKG